MTIENSKIMPEFFLCDQCVDAVLPDEVPRTSPEALRKKIEEIHKRCFSCEEALDNSPAPTDVQEYFDAISELQRQGWRIKFTVSAVLERLDDA